MLDLHRLRVFRSVVASGSIQAAAVNLGYTASAVSQHVAALQRETGLQLVSRVGRGIAPTSAGHALAAEVDTLLASLGAVETVVGDLRAGRTGSLSMAYFPSVGATWMPAVVAQLQTDFPEIRLELSLREDVAPDPVAQPDLQVAVEQPGVGTRLGRTSIHLLDDPYVVVLRSDDPLAVQSEIALADLSERQWVDNDFARGWCRRNLIESCHAAGFSPPYQVEAHDYPTAIAFVRAGTGVTVLPSLGASILPDGVVAVPVVTPTPVRSIYALVQQAVAESPAIGRALQTLREQARVTGSTHLR